MATSTFRSVCRHADGDLVHTDETEFLFHWREQHHRRPYTRRVLPVRMWHTPRPKPFTVEPFGLGDWVTWTDRDGVHEGQVWALFGKDTRWVADGTEYHRVYVSQLVERQAMAS